MTREADDTRRRDVPTGGSGRRAEAYGAPAKLKLGASPEVPSSILARKVGLDRVSRCIINLVGQSQIFSNFQ